MTPAGRAFLDHARWCLSQAEAASEAARRVAHPSSRASRWLFDRHEWVDARTLRILRDELPNIDVWYRANTPAAFADSLSKGKIDVAFLGGRKGCRTWRSAFSEEPPHGVLRVTTPRPRSNP